VYLKYPCKRPWRPVGLRGRITGSFKSSYTQGYDEISNNILKACKNFINIPLSYLCNRMLFEGVFPERLKYAEIVPVYKKR
jgi:hypothetical protein